MQNVAREDYVEAPAIERPGALDVEMRGLPQVGQASLRGPSAERGQCVGIPVSRPPGPAWEAFSGQYGVFARAGGDFEKIARGREFFGQGVDDVLSVAPGGTGVFPAVVIVVQIFETNGWTGVVGGGAHRRGKAIRRSRSAHFPD